ncbi:MAG: PatB family C-S lyase [Rugosibacter sp.]|jgi:cystathionine beta-lyase|nr:cysteine-S-conjugate beta-lyase [Rugosibacter sp.]
MSGRFNFDAPVERSGTDSEKWAKYAGRDILPLWVADMDFAAPPAIIDALQSRIAHGVFGYNQPTLSQTQAVVDYLARQFGYAIDPAWIVWLPGLVSGLNVACRTVGEAGDAVFTATPIYPPFLSAPKNAGRPLATVPLVQGENRWAWDFDAVDATLQKTKPRLFLLCHPHNPTGRAWDDDELRQIARLAEKHDLVICSDEIHNGLILSPSHQHRLFASLDGELAQRTITLMAPSKTFNIPGLGAAFAVIANPALRKQFIHAMAGIVPHTHLLGMVALEAAFTKCDPWHQALLDYLRGNAEKVFAAVDNISGLHMHRAEATYLAWIDAREFAQARGIESLAKHFESHGLGLSDGVAFGAPGFVRLNFGTQRNLLETALERLAAS